MIITNNYDIDDDNDNGIDGNKDDSDDDDLSVAADSGLMQRGVEGGESEAREEQVDLGGIFIFWYLVIVIGYDNAAKLSSLYLVIWYGAR